MSRFVFVFILCVLGTELFPTQQVSANPLHTFWKWFIHGLRLDGQPNTNVIDTNTQTYGFNGNTWECCKRIHVEALHIDDTACLKLLYLPEAIGFEVDIIWNEKTIYKASMSVRNPPPMCVGLPHLTKIDVCIIVYNITFTDEPLSACVKLRIEAYIYEDFHLGCFTLPLSIEKKSGHHLYKRSLDSTLAKPIQKANIFKYNKTP